MASLPSPSQVAGPHYQIYDAYYTQLDPKNTGKIGAMDAARILKKSKLSDIVLSKIWDYSDPQQQGHLTREGFFVALKLCALAQSGRGTSMDNILANDVPVPKLGEIPKIPNKINESASAIDWTVKPPEKAKYNQLFDSLQPTNGVLPGAKVRGVLMESKLPVDMLGRIWDLADIDRDGSLSRHEFMIAMHLVYKALEKHAIPTTLPVELMPPGKRKESVQSPTLFQAPPTKPAVPPQPVAMPSRPPPIAAAMQPVVTEQPIAFASFPPVTVNHSTPSLIPTLPPAVSSITGLTAPPKSTGWVVTADEKITYDKLFSATDFDMDGFVSGNEIKDVFLKSGVAQPTLARIWALCDTSQSGKLNNEQFALAMWLIKRQLEGVEPPAALTPEMVPPSLRTQIGDTPKVEAPAIPTYSNPELEMIAADIRELTKEKLTLESDIATKEAEVRLRENEVRNLQSEYDTLAATLRQLETQKGEAQKRLNDLNTQKNNFELELAEVVAEVEAEQALVDKLRSQADEQEESLKSQESEVNSKKQELENLKLEEQRLEKEHDENRVLLEELSKQLQESQLQISQVKAKVSEMEEAQRQMRDAVASCDAALSSNDSTSVTDATLSLGPAKRDADITRLMEETPTKDNVAFNGSSSASGFDAQFPANDAFTNGNAADPFESATLSGANDPFGTPFAAPARPPVPGSSDPFDPFGDSTASVTANAKTPLENDDPFGCDPFANLHAPERNSSTSATPAPTLPPKKAKQPPPRPAPPRPAPPSGGGSALRAAPAPPTPTSSISPSPSPDPTPFVANFANFDSKFNSNSSSSSPFTSPADTTSTPYQVTSSVRGGTTPSPFEFTEDPFKNYRYEDVFEISDPFAETTASTTTTTTFDAKFPPIDAFDANFSAINNNKNNNLFNGKEKFSDANGNLNKPKIDIVITPQKQQQRRKEVDEDLQLAWAARESLRIEEERKKREEQERKDFEFALALSKEEVAPVKDTTSSNKSPIKNFLRLGKSHAPT